MKLVDQLIKAVCEAQELFSDWNVNSLGACILMHSLVGKNLK